MLPDEAEVGAAAEPHAISDELCRRPGEARKEAIKSVLDLIRPFDVAVPVPADAVMHGERDSGMGLTWVHRWQRLSHSVNTLRERIQPAHAYR